MAKNLVYVGVIVLAVIAVVLGYKIYQQTALKNQPVSTSQQPASNTVPKSTNKQATP